MERKKHAAFGTKEWNAIEHAVYEFFRHEGYKLSGDGKSAQARDFIQRLAAYGDVILNDEGADMTRVLRDLANMGTKGDVGKAKEYYGKMDDKNFKGSKKNTAEWPIGHLKKMIAAGFLDPNTGKAIDPPIDQAEIDRLVASLIDNKACLLYTSPSPRDS